jgi:hypothetical protein
MADQDHRILKRLIEKSHKSPLKGMDLCLFEASKMYKVLTDERVDLPLDSGQKYAFQKIWDNQIQKPDDQGKTPTIESLSAFYSSAIAVAYQGVLGLKTPGEARKKAEENGDVIGIDSKKFGKRQFDVALDAFVQAFDEHKQPYSEGEINKYRKLGQILSGAARLGLSIAIMEDIKKNDLAKSILSEPFLQTKTHIDDVSSAQKLLSDTFIESNLECVINITQTSDLFKALEDKDKRLVNSSFKIPASKEDATDTLDRFVAGENGYEIGPAHKLTRDTVRPNSIEQTERMKSISGVQAGIGIIRNNKPTVGLPVFGMTNFIMQIEHTREAFGFKGKNQNSSTIITSQPHDKLADELGEAAEKREQKAFEFTQNLLSHLPGQIPLFYKVKKKEDFLKDTKFKPKSIDDFTPEQQTEILKPVPDDKDVAYFLMESAMIDLLKSCNNSVKVSWANEKKICTERNFDEAHEIIKNITTNGSGMDYVYFEALHSFTGKTLAPYAVSEDEAEKTMLLEDLEQEDGRKYIEKAKTDLNIDDAFKVAETKEQGLFGTKLAYLMLKHGDSKEGKKAISEMLNTINNVKTIYTDTAIESPKKRPDVSPEPEDFEATHEFICQNMKHIYNKYMKQANEAILEEYVNGATAAKQQLNNNIAPPKRVFL